MCQTILDSLPGVDELAKTEPWLVDGGWTGVDEEVIENTAEEGARERSHHGDPEVVPSCGPDVCAVADAVGPETGAEVTGEVDGETGLPAKGGADAELRLESATILR